MLILQELSTIVIHYTYHKEICYAYFVILFKHFLFHLTGKFTVL